MSLLNLAWLQLLLVPLMGAALLGRGRGRQGDTENVPRGSAQLEKAHQEKFAESGQPEPGD